MASQDVEPRTLITRMVMATSVVSGLLRDVRLFKAGLARRFRDAKRDDWQDLLARPDWQGVIF